MTLSQLDVVRIAVISDRWMNEAFPGSKLIDVLRRFIPAASVEEFVAVLRDCAEVCLEMEVYHTEKIALLEESLQATQQNIQVTSMLLAEAMGISVIDGGKK